MSMFYGMQPELVWCADDNDGFRSPNMTLESKINVKYA